MASRVRTSPVGLSLAGPVKERVYTIAAQNNNFVDSPRATPIMKSSLLLNSAKKPASPRYPAHAPARQRLPFKATYPTGEARSC